MGDVGTFVRRTSAMALDYSSSVARRIADLATLISDELVFASIKVYPQAVLDEIGDFEWIPDWMERREVDGRTLIMHKEEVCHPPCPVHAPSEHHMTDWPLFWRQDRGIFERGCPHGVGHPDPDTIKYLLATDPQNGDRGVHGCDGCCATRVHG